MEQPLYNSNNKISEILLLIIAFTLPFYQQASIIAIIALALLSILQKKFLQLPSAFGKNKLLLLWVSYFILHLAGLLWSENLHYGWLDIQTKLSFLIFPLVLGTSIISAASFRKIKRAFVAGNMIACMYCLAMALIKYSRTSDPTVFYYEFYSALMHTTYFSIYLSLALLFLLEHAIYNWKDSTLLQRIWLVTGIMFIVVNLILLSARMAIAVCFVTVIFYCITEIIKFKRGIFFLIISVIVIVSLSFVITRLYNRYTQFNEVAAHIENPNTPIPAASVNAAGYNSTTARVEFWKNAIEVIKRNWLKGVGTGDIKEELVKQYAKVNFQYGVENKFSPHNQYLHTGVILGITGIILLLCCLLLPLRSAIKNRNWLYVCFLIIILLNAITESILERQNGIIFYAFFNILFFMQSINSTDESA